jgi:hypothetical protein
LKRSPAAAHALASKGFLTDLRRALGSVIGPRLLL